MAFSRKFCCSILWLFLVVIPCARNTSSQHPNFRIFTTEQGLAHDSINRIVRDSRGFMWFCTAEGLSRYDGKRFTNFTQDQGLPHRNVSAMLETHDGKLLIGTSNGVVLFNPLGRPYRWNIAESHLEQDGDDPPMFRTFEPPGEITNFHRRVYALAEDHDGVIWVATGGALYRVTIENDELKFEEEKIEDATTTYGYLLPDSRGGLIVNGAHLYRIFHGKVTVVSPDSGLDMAEDPSGRIWVGASGEKAGVRVYEFNDVGDLVHTRTYTTKDGLGADTHFRAVMSTADGRMFFGGDFNGLSEFIGERGPGEPKFRSLANDYVSALAEDMAGNVWVGTDLKGVWELRDGGFESFGAKDGIPEGTDISSISVHHDGGVYLSAWPNMIMRLNSSGKFDSIAPAGLKSRSWGWHFQDLETLDGEWWIPALRGLYRYPRIESFDDLARTQPQKIYYTEDGIWHNETFNIFEDSHGNVWITTFGRDGNTLARWDRATNVISAYGTQDGLPRDNGAISFAEDGHGDIWFGHYFGGLVRYRSGTFKMFEARDGLPQTQIDDLHVDSQGRLWIATTGRGLFRVDDTSADTPSFTSISTQNGLSSNQIICIAEDQFNQLYIGTGHGINRIDSTGNIRVFTQADGLPSNYITRCAADRQGHLWFVSQKTLVRLKADVDRIAAPPSTFIDRIAVAGVPKQISALGETNVELPEFGPDEHQIQVDYFALTLGEGENVRYQYRLDDNDWSQPTNQQSVNLDLSSGAHEFAARAVRSGGTLTGNPAVARIRIRPPIWARWWFILGSVFLGSCFLLAFYKYRTRHLRQVNAALAEAAIAEERLGKAREERLAELEKVRSRIATDLHDDIGASLTQIAVLSEVARAKNAANGSSEPLVKISEVSNELVESMSDIVWSINPKKDHLTDLTQRMRRFAADILSARGIAFQFKAPDNHTTIVTSNIRRETFLIYKELVNNVVKHSNAKRVTISIEVDSDFLTLEVNDDGNGFDASGLDPREVTDSQFALINPASMGGNGLRNMFRRVREMDGEIVVRSDIGKGTTTILTFPLEPATRAGGLAPDETA